MANNKRQKVTNLFNKNHVSLTRADQLPEYESRLNLNGYAYIDEKKFGYQSKTCYSLYSREKEKVEITCESPLGFYYKKKVDKLQAAANDGFDVRNQSIRVLEVYVDDVKYTLSYTIRYNDIKLSKELRPWEIYPKEKAMPEHFVGDLLKEVDSLFDKMITKKMNIIEIEGKRLFADSPDTGKCWDVHTIKRIIYEELFGWPDGPKFQTNDEKIESHGFDTVTSFRNM